jgi:predicted nucleic acid-binding protein
LNAISNATPLIYLGKLGQLGLLFKLYAQVLIPKEVYTEVVINGLRLGAPEAQYVDYLIRQKIIQLREVILPNPLPSWAQTIDAGEVEVILLAQEQSADWVLIDNHHARRAARQLGLSVKGTVGILLDAYRQQHLTLREFELLIQYIKSQPDIWISDRLCDEALASARQYSQSKSRN